MRRITVAIYCLWLSSALTQAGRSPLFGEETDTSTTKRPIPAARGESDEKLIPLNQQKTVLLDRAGGRLILETEVVFREGLLEMLICLKQTKEHESILSLDAQARTVHAGLLALGAQPGTPVSWDPDFQPPTGQRIEITLKWQDSKGEWQSARAQNWMRGVTRKYFIAELKELPDGFKMPENSDLRYDPKHHELLWFGIMSKEDRDSLLKLSRNMDYQTAVKSLYEASQIKPMTSVWVFAGSGFYVDEQTGKQYYLAENGNLVCVANFSSALLDVQEQSSDTDGGQSYEAWEDRIPPLGTKVRVELKPVKAAAENDVKPVEK